MKACLQMQPEFCSREKLLHYFKIQLNEKPTPNAELTRPFKKYQDSKTDMKVNEPHETYIQMRYGRKVIKKKTKQTDISMKG